MADTFAPTWLYHATMPPELVESQDRYDFLMAQGGWADTPAAHGVITAPNKDEQFYLQQQTMSQAPAPMVMAAPPWLSKQEEMETEIDALHVMLRTEREQRETLQEAVADLTARVAALEPHATHTARREEKK